MDGATRPACMRQRWQPARSSLPAGDAERLAGALSEIAADPELRTRMGEASRRIVAGWGYEPSVRGFLSAVRTAAGAGR